MFSKPTGKSQHKTLAMQPSRQFKIACRLAYFLQAHQLQTIQVQKPERTTTGLNSQISAHRPLYLLDRAASELLDTEVERLSALDSSIPTDELVAYLKAALLQAYYGIPDYEAFSDHVRFNSLFRSFIGLNDTDNDWDAERYSQVHRRWTLDQELREFLNDLIEVVTGLPISPDDMDSVILCNQIEDRLSKWIDLFCPKAVYFQQFSHPPVKRFSATLVFPPVRHKSDINSVLTEDVTRIIEAVFPKPIEQEEKEYGIDELVFLSGNEEHSLLLQFEKLSLSSNPEVFESWEDSVKPYLTPMLDVCTSSDDYSSPRGAMLHFGNVINLPIEADLYDYFHMLPMKPPQVVPPRLMREENLMYSFPNRMIRAAYRTDLLYDKQGQLLRCTYVIDATGGSSVVELDLEAHWAEPFSPDETQQVFNELKNNLYVAFHSLITDRTRAQFE